MDKDNERYNERRDLQRALVDSVYAMDHGDKGNNTPYSKEEREYLVAAIEKYVALDELSIKDQKNDIEKLKQETEARELSLRETESEKKLALEERRVMVEEDRMYVERERIDIERDRVKIEDKSRKDERALKAAQIAATLVGVVVNFSITRSLMQNNTSNLMAILNEDVNGIITPRNTLSKWSPLKIPFMR